MKQFLILCFAWCISTYAIASNTITLSSVSGTPQTEVEVVVSLDNTDAITALEMVLPLGEHLSYVNGSATLATTRSNGHQLSAAQVGQELRIYVYSLSLNALQGDTGELLTFRLLLGNEPADYALTPTVVLSNAQGTSIAGSTQTGTVAIQAPKLQIVNSQIDYGHIPIRATYTKSLQLKNVGNLPLTIENIATTDPLFVPKQNTLTIEAQQTAAVTIEYAPIERGAVNHKVMVTSNAINGEQVATIVADPFSVNELHIGTASGIADSIVTVSLMMNNMEPIVAMQCAFKLPKQLEYVANSLAVNAVRSNGHQTLSTVHGDTLVLMLYSISNQPLHANDGEIATFQIRLNGSSGTYYLKPIDVVLSNITEENMVSATSQGKVTIKAPAISSNASLAFGSHAITEEAYATYSVRNNGSAPLVLERATFLAEGYRVVEELPITIANYKTTTITVAYQPTEEGDFSTTMNLYTNDPNNRLKTVMLSGNIYAPNSLSIEGQTQTDGTYALSIGLNNYSNIVAIQYDIHWLSDMRTSTNDFVPSNRINTHNYLVTLIGENVYRVIIYSMNNTMLQGHVGEVHQLIFTPTNDVDYNNSVILIDNIVLSDVAGKNQSTEDRLEYIAIQTGPEPEPVQQCGDNLFWEYADGVLTIIGTGDMYDYADDKTGPAPWYDVRGSITTINMPNEMTKIGDYAFYKCTEVTSINMPTTLTAIGEKAFAQDTKLACEIILPASMTTIASRAFFNCQAVTAFHLEATTPPTIPNDAFERTTAPIHVPCGYGHIYGKHTQWGELNLEMCELLQDNVYYYPIDSYTARAVTYHSNPTDTIVIPSAVVIDGVPRTVTEVADFAFTDCDDLPAIYFSEGLEYIGERAFVRCYGLHGTIVLPATLETIGERAFSYCNNVDRYTIQAMTPPALGANVFTGDNKNALFYISCEAMDDYKVATNWSSLKSRLRDACLNIYHYNTALGANGVHTTEDTLVASIYYRRKFTLNSWETLYLPFEVDRVTVLEDGVEYDLTAWDIVNGGHYYLAKPYGIENKEVVFAFTQVVDAHTPYIIQFKEPYFHDKMITFHGKESWNKLSSSFEALPISFEMQMAGNTTLQDQILEEPVYMLRATSNFILQNTTTTLHPFECYVMPYATPSGTPARMNVRFRGDVPTAIENTDTPSNIGVHKLLRNGQLLILRAGKTYDVIGQKVE